MKRQLKTFRIDYPDGKSEKVQAENVYIGDRGHATFTADGKPILAIPGNYTRIQVEGEQK